MIPGPQVLDKLSKTPIYNRIMEAIELTLNNAALEDNVHNYGDIDEHVKICLQGHVSDRVKQNVIKECKNAGWRSVTIDNREDVEYRSKTNIIRNKTIIIKLYRHGL